MNQVINDDSKLTANQLLVKYTAAGEHPIYTDEKFQMSGSAEDDYWRWVRDRIAEEFTQTGTEEQIAAAMKPEGDCQSCVDDKCITGPECVTTSNPHPGIINGVRVDVCDGKYSVIMNGEGGLQALRHGEPWPGNDITGSKFIHWEPKTSSSSSRTRRSATC
jgi:hypothetical protein